MLNDSEIRQNMKLLDCWLDQHFDIEFYDGEEWKDANMLTWHVCNVKYRRKQPMFKVGDTVERDGHTFLVTGVADNYYWINSVSIDKHQAHKVYNHV